MNVLVYYILHVISVLVLTGYGRETNHDRERWPCEPALVAKDLLEAIRLILDTVPM
jgi:hypothetical protein